MESGERCGRNIRRTDAQPLFSIFGLTYFYIDRDQSYCLPHSTNVSISSCSTIYARKYIHLSFENNYILFLFSTLLLPTIQPGSLRIFSLFPYTCSYLATSLLTLFLLTQFSEASEQPWCSAMDSSRRRWKD